MRDFTINEECKNMLPYYQYFIIYVMGQQISQNRELNAQKGRSVQVRYQTKLFLKNRKSNTRFREELESICKRSSYLHYEWAKELLKELKNNNLNKLYTDYQSILKENCLREGKREKIFCPAKIQRQFIIDFSARVNKVGIQPSVRLLDDAFEECKCYFMVMGWLHKMVTLSSNDQQNKNSYIAEDWDLSEEEKIYETLIGLSLRIYQQVKQGGSERTEFDAKSEHMNPHLVKLVKRLMISNLKFAEKEAVIVQLQRQLESDPDSIQENVHLLRKIIGVDRIYAHLRTIREVGHVDISLLWAYFGEEL